MTTLRDQLHSIAVGAPTTDLTERVIRKADRRRAGGYASGVAAVLAIAVAAVTVSGGGQREEAVIVSKVTDTLPASGVGPLNYAYYDWCGEKWEPGVNTHRFTKECAQWNVVTSSGHTYRMPEALSVYTEQTANNYMNTNAPLVISANGARVAYYSEKKQKIAVRDLRSGRVWLMPTELSRAEMVSKGVMLTLSPDGGDLGIGDGRGNDEVVEVETGKLTVIPEGWNVRAVGDGGDPLIVRREGQDKLGALMSDGTVRAFPALKDPEPLDLSLLSPDGRTLAYVTGSASKRDPSKPKGISGRSEPTDSIVTLDSASGEILHRTRLRGEPRDFHAMRTGGWLSRTEVIVADYVMGAHLRGAHKRSVTPTFGQRTYRVNVRTGQVTPLATYTYQAWAGSLELPGF
jgi:hypothetical protein